MIISGFAGIGKSTVAKRVPGFVDLESTPFEKDWDRYVKVIKHMDNNGYTVCVSCHDGLRKKLLENGLKYYLIMPEEDLKDEYLERYEQRGNTEKFIQNMRNNWDSYVTPMKEEENFLIRLKSGEFLEDLYKGD